MNVVEYALKFLGRPYVWGGDGSGKFGGGGGSKCKTAEISTGMRLRPIAARKDFVAALRAPKWGFKRLLLLLLVFASPSGKTSLQAPLCAKNNVKSKFCWLGSNKSRSRAIPWAVLCVLRRF